MTLKTLATGSSGNCYILTSGSGKHLILDAGIPIKEIKKGLDFDVENVQGCIITHCHKDHHLAVKDLKAMGIPVWQPYLDEKHKRIKTKLGDFKLECFDVFHNNTPCRAFLISADCEKILYATDYEFIGYDLRNQGITVMLIELNYSNELVSDDNDHIQHLCRGHAEAKTTLEFIQHNSKKLHTVLFCHMSKSGNLNRKKVEKMIPDYIPPWCRWDWCKPDKEWQIDSIPF